MYPKLFGIDFINMYGLMIGIGVLCCFAVLGLFCKKKNIDPKFLSFVEWNGLLAILVGFVFAILLQSIYNYIEKPELGFHIEFNMTFIGGLIGGAGSFLVVYFTYGRKKYGAKLLDILPIIPACILVAHGFGRIGCFCAGCCHGIETDSIFGMYFPTRGGTYYPTQLYEAIFLFLLFGLCFWLAIKKNSYGTFSIYLLAYGVFRFFIEMIRGDHRGELVGSISPSQFWSIVMVVIAIPIYYLIRYLQRMRDKASEASSN